MTTIRLWILALCATFISAGAIVAAAPAAAQTCEGDCNGDGAVEIGELILGVRTALGTAPIGDCHAMDGDGNGIVTINELIAAVTDAVQQCSGRIVPTSTSTRAPTNTSVPPPSTPTPSITPVPTTDNDAALAAAARVGTEPLFRLFDFQARVGTPVGVAGRSTISGCQQFDCVSSGRVTGTERDCCSATRFSQTFDNCQFDDDLGRVVSLNGMFALHSETADVCTGAIPVGASFDASLIGLTHDVRFPDGSFSRTFQVLSETFEFAPGGCTVRQPDPSGFGIRGDGRRSIGGELQRFESDGSGNIQIDSESDVALAIAVGSTQEADGCTVAAALNGSLTSADFRGGTQFSTDLTDLQVVERPQRGALLLELNGTVGTDCLGDVTLSTIEPLRIASGDGCFTGGHLELPPGDGTASLSVIYTQSAGLDLHFGDGSADQHFGTCTDVPATGKCSTRAIGLCGACAAADECQSRLSCSPCADGCTGTSRRCSLADTSVTCADGIF